ncbi:LytTR family DNA-binding domain-containing protein [Aurantiacibacter sp. D1-12]|uniref:LytTR family DNA-binding domain-containing protein n=1 Tax=Aurantiacibacter sp. D1-12 TaxID=2993658 RepID=UPI00237C7B5E|nr:LytTR family DNA-binding domain-containing protein [Aurantiacibacter sp. D1-12]MDE1467215.1 LytTR family DNA-binding domain-containing protein [Aurantiacibacter sp. D1-12]
MDAAQPKPLAARILTDLGVMTVIGVVLALIGPMGSFNDPLPLRLVVWLGFAWLGYALYAPIDTLATRLAPSLQLPPWSLRIVGVLVSSIPMSVAVFVLVRDPEFWKWPGLEFAMTHYFYVVMIGGLITLVNTLIQRPRVLAEREAAVARATSTPTPPVVEPQRSAMPFLDRLPPELGTQLIALEMEDHYVRAHTALGSELVLMRMRDAVAELDGLEGEQVHRSWWVARAAVADVKREGRNVRLVLDNGVEAPVSRANVTPLKDAGWF